MFIKLTNAADEYKGQPLVIKKDIILSVYSALIEIKKDDEVLSLSQQTIVFSTHCTWQVEESVAQVFEQLSK